MVKNHNLHLANLILNQVLIAIAIKKYLTERLYKICLYASIFKIMNASTFTFGMKVTQK